MEPVVDLFSLFILTARSQMTLENKPRAAKMSDSPYFVSPILFKDPRTHKYPTKS